PHRHRVTASPRSRKCVPCACRPSSGRDRDGGVDVGPLTQLGQAYMTDPPIPWEHVIRRYQLTINKYTTTEHDDGRVAHFIDHDTGSFIVSSEEVGVSVHNFLHHATLEDIATLHGHLLRAYARRSGALDAVPQTD